MDIINGNIGTYFQEILDYELKQGKNR